MKQNKRVARLKYILIGTFITFLLLPIGVCIFLAVKVNGLEDEISDISVTLKEMQKNEAVYEEIQSTGNISETTDSVYGDGLITEADGRKFIPSKRKVYLTFDDGPSANTSEILDVLKEYNVKATFFVIGKEDEYYAPLYKRIVEEGHTIGMHSYSHKYQEIYKSEEAFQVDFRKLRRLIYDNTGVWSYLYRFPGGSSNNAATVEIQKLISYLDEEGITYFDWNISSQDASAALISAERIADNVVSQVGKFEESVVLMHDAAEKKTTVESLSIIIEALQQEDDLEFLPITGETAPTQHITLEEHGG